MFDDKESLQVIPKLAAIEAPDAPSGELDGAISVPLPPELAGKTGLRTHDTLETNPTVRFGNIGEYVLGTYAGLRVLTIDGRQQRAYDLRTPSNVVVTVWGSTILNGRMDDAIKAGLIVGRSLMIQFLGDVDTGKPSAAHNFRVVWK